MSAVTAVPLRPLAPRSVLRLWVGLALLALAALALGWWGTRGLQRTILPSGVQYQVIREGSGEQIASADVAAVHFVGRRESGEVIADTRRDRPVEVTTDNFLPGLGDGLKLMRKGSVYRFWVPPSVWRGQVGANVPFGPDETLSFDVQVIEVAPGAAQARRMQELQRQLQSGGAAPAAGPGVTPGAEGRPAAPGGPPPVVAPPPAGGR
jgi:FKBP-type peptidyl-prolyl cis-trans isomerase FkpA